MNEKKNIISKEKLLEAGVYFGHRKNTWNPKMKPYIVATKKGTHILDVEKTRRTLEFAYSLVKSYAEKGASFIFVGTRKQAQETIKKNALRTNSYYVSERWLGGTLTNSRTIFRRVYRMFDLEKLAENNFTGYTKKEGLLMQKELDKLHKNLSGIKNMKQRPNVMIVADPSKDEIAVKEAKRLGVKVIGIVDTNNDPSNVHVAIPANDDSIKSVTLIITVLADAIASAKGGKQEFAYQSDDLIVLPDEPVKEQKNRFRSSRPSHFRRFNNNERPQRTRENIRKDIKIDSDANKVTQDKVTQDKVTQDKNEKIIPEKIIPEKKVDQELSSLKVAELRELAKSKDIEKTSTMKKDELIKALK